MVNLQEIRLHVCVECFPSLQGTGDPREAQASQYKIKVCIIFCQMNLYNSPLLQILCGLLPSVALVPRALASLASVEPFSINCLMADSNISLTLSAQF